ncbi:beta subunit of N-acylethanolamine-hydrolyzing acid amidase-domain-containing protein [Aspergillus karnatakaensis]|uniref:uncharacterized protein n=1 Tax=Aspergillus karnatakaensis TaxID=1810916 RepID=UPI003CCDBE8B
MDNEGDIPPTHTINLSLSPRDRYKHLATLYRPQLQSITSLFDSLVLQIFPESYLPWIKSLARFFLRGVKDHDESEEIRGIADAAGVDVYLVVCLNVLLDLLMGCTSGGVLSSIPGEEEQGSGSEEKRMLHFRTLDWDMPALRQLLVQLEFVDSASEHGNEVLATNITYVGFIGVLTGVRPGLSVSLNFRPNHDDSSWIKQVKYYGRHLLVLLGFKRSISSVLRSVIIPSRLNPTSKSTSQAWLSWFWLWTRRTKQEEPHTLSLATTVQRITATPSTACYLILSNGTETYVVEKDYKTTTVESSTSFIVATNNDRNTTIPQSSDPSARQEHTGASLTAGERVDLAWFIKDSIERRACMQSHWDMKVARSRHVRRQSQESGVTLQARRDPLGRTSSSRRGDAVSSFSSASAAGTATSTAPTTVDTPTCSASDNEVTATLEEVITWTTRYPTTNEMTHFATVMDPTKGTVAWIRRYPEPLECEWEVTDFD